MKGWDFPRAADDLWRALTPDRKHDIAVTCCSKRSGADDLPLPFQSIALKTGSRPQTFFKLPIDTRAAKFVTYYDKRFQNPGDAVASYLLRKYRPMLSSFLDGLQIPHVNAMIDKSSRVKPAAERLEQSIADLLARYPEEDVALYIQLLATRRDETWSNLSSIDFQRIDVLMHASRTRQSGPEEDVRNPESDVIPEPSVLPDLKDDADSILANVNELRKRCDSEAERLSTLAAELRNSACPAEYSDASLNTIRNLFSTVSEAIEARCSLLGVPYVKRSPVCISQFENAIAMIREAEHAIEQQRSIRERATSLLGRIDRLAVIDGRPLKSLDACKRRATELQNAIESNSESLPPDWEHLLRIYESLLKLIRPESANDPVSDEELLDDIGRKFGGSLAIAVSGGRICLIEAGLEALKPDTDKAPDGNGDDAWVAEQPVLLADRAAERSTIEVAQPTTNGMETLEPPKYLDTEPEAIESGDVTEIDSKHNCLERDVPSDPNPPSTGEPDHSVPFDPAANAQSIASSMLQEEKYSGAEIRKLVWSLLWEGRSSAAYHLASAAAAYESEDALELSIRLRAEALGQHIAHPVSPLSDRLREDFSTLLGLRSSSSENALAYRLLAISASIRPALISPDTGARSLLAASRSGSRNLHHLNWLCERVIEFSNLNLSIDSHTLQYLDSSGSTSTLLAELKAATSAWRDDAPNLPFKFAPAGKLWRAWLSDGGRIDRLIQPILTDDVNALEGVKDLLEEFRSEGDLRLQINSDDRQLRGRTFGGGLNAPSMSVFIRHVREAAEFAKRWVALQEHRPTSQADYRFKKLRDLREEIEHEQNSILSELNNAEVEANDLGVKAGLASCKRAVENLVSLLHIGPTDGRAEPEIKFVLGKDLLLNPNLQLSEEWEPLNPPEATVRAIAEHIDAGSSTVWSIALNWFDEAFRSHDRVDRIIDYLRWWSSERDLLDDLIEAQDRHVRSCKRLIQRTLEKCRNKIDWGVSLGLISSADRTSYLERAERVQRNLDQELIRDFGPAEQALLSITNEIEQRRKARADAVRRRLADAKISPDSEAYKRIETCIQKPDFDSANEYIDRAVSGNLRGLLEDFEERQSTLQAFFPEGASKIESFLNDRKNAGSILNRLETGKLPGASTKELTEKQLGEAVELYEAWVSLNKLKQADSALLGKLISRLGFSKVNVSESTAYPRAYMHMRTAPLTHRSQCPVPAFGSIANGSYRLICIWDHPSEEEILNTVRQSAAGAPAIVLYFGRLSEQSRRYIAQLCHEDSIGFILIDEILLLFLCSQKNRMRVLFDCTLAFTSISPYLTVGSNVPPEMFYGRRNEASAIQKEYGPCFVYGGRQLGKTALLLSIRDNFHNPAEGRIAIWIDIRFEAETVWNAIINAFKELPKDELGVAETSKKSQLIERIYAWLKADSHRRILLLLDEADRFLEYDSRNSFHETSALKNIMDMSKCRFKVVFAGLHNVQRATKQQNHPLAHFGTPICIGPLLDGNEVKQAKALIEQPLLSLGFRFESPDLIFTILSRTNYYPCLIQLYCQLLLLETLRDYSTTASRRNTPPYVITSDHVERAYSSSSSGIKEKLDLTLNLDSRYRALALIIAFNMHHSQPQDSDAVAVGSILRDAKIFWEEGFRSCRSDDDLRVLLEEMVGLGVLREAGSGFALRTPNLLYHFGTQSDVETCLENWQQTPVPAIQNHIIRSADREEVWRRSPIAVSEENELREIERNTVTILSGSRAASFDDIPKFLAQTFSKQFVVCDLTSADRAEFRRFISENQEKTKAGVTGFLVQSAPWSWDWVEEALEWSRTKRVHSRFAAIIFAADPAAVWRLSEHREEMESYIAQSQLRSISLQPWNSSFLVNWLIDCGIGSNLGTEQRRISEVTGNWPCLLSDFRERWLRNLSWQTSLDDLSSELKSSKSRKDLSALFGLDIEEGQEVLEEIAALGGQVSAGDLLELSSLSADRISKVLFWAARLSLIVKASGDEWRLDPVVSTLLMSEKNDGLVVASRT